MPDTGGLILCGGKSTRMGTSKAWLPFGDEVMLQRMTRILSKCVEPIVVVGAPGQQLPALDPSVFVCRDEFPDKGPLAGIYTGLRNLNNLDVESAFVTACDNPFLRSELVQYLHGHLSPQTDIVMLKDGKFSHVLAALYRTRISSTALELMDLGRQRPIELTDRHPTKWIDIELAREADPMLESFINMNSPEDYQSALNRLNAKGN